MCGRYSITLPPEAIRQLFQTHGELPNWPAYYNAPPTTALPIVRQAKDGGGRELVLMQWGLIPWFSKDGKPSYSTINARAEGVQSAASFREPFSKGRRCIVPASGYFEWIGRRTIDSRITSARDGQPMALLDCGIDGRARKRQRPKRSSLLSRLSPASSLLIPNRMPLVLEPDTWDLWMKGDPVAAAALMKPANEDVLVSRPVSKAVGM